ncbi:MAG: ABC transporter ATP-binding protein [Bacteroidota bacterium]
MSDVVIKVEGLGKQYRLGSVGTGTISHDLNRFWAKVRGKEDPYLKIGETNDRSKKGNSDLVWAIKNINFEVNKGEVLGIIGKNGAGKSTLLKVLSRVTGPTVGDIKVKGRIASLLEVGTGFHPELTGRENIFLNGAILGMTKREIRSKFDEIVDFSGVERYIDTPVKRYSSGMYVRLAFAVAAHLEPEILIVDEVLAVGDAEFQKKCLGKMKDVSGQGRTVLFVSHNMAAVKGLCTKGIILENGEVKFSGGVEEAVNFYTRSGYSLAAIPIKERTDRKGNGKLRVTDIKFINNLNTSVSELTSGEYYKIQFNFEKYNEIDVKQLTFVLQFKNESDEVVTTIATDEQGTTFTEIASKGFFEVEIPRLVFREGRYTLHFMISEKLAFNTPHVTMDYLADAVIMDVIRGDYWNSGILNRPKGFVQESSIKLLNY